MIRSLLALLSLCMATTCFALEIGEPAPAYQGLAGIDGKAYSLRDYAEAKVVVVCFTCNSCPVAAGYQERFNAFVKTYEAKGVKFIAFNTCDPLDAMKQRAAEEKFAFPYVQDDSGDTARGFGAKVTPQLFVLDAERKLAYSGAFDDDLKESNVKKRYVSEAVEALLAGRKPETSVTKPVGCGIKLKKS